MLIAMANSNTQTAHAYIDDGSFRTWVHIHIRYYVLLLLLLRLLLSSGLGLGSFLLIAPNHDHADEGADNGRTQEEEDDGNANGPDAGEEQVLKGVVLVNEGL